MSSVLPLLPVLPSAASAAGVAPPCSADIRWRKAASSGDSLAAAGLASAAVVFCCETCSFTEVINSEALVPFSSTVTLSDALLRLALSELLAAGVAAVLLAAAGCSSVPASRSSRWARLS